ncbi:MAG: TolC family protein [Calditrichaceae bacterium]
MVHKKFNTNIKTVYIICMIILILPVITIAQTAATYISMDEAINRALNKNNLIKSSEYGIKKATWDKRRAWTQLFPSLTINSRYMWIDDSTFALRDFSRYFRNNDDQPPMPGFGVDIPQTVFQESYFTSLDADWQIFNAAVLNGLSIAGRSKQMAEEQYESTMNGTLFQVISAYLNVIYYMETLKWQNEYLELSRLNYEKAERLHEAGRYSKMEALRWKVDYQQQKSLVKNSESVLRSSYILLKRLINFDMEKNIQVENNIPDLLMAESSKLKGMPDEDILDMINLNDDELVEANAALAAAQSNKELNKLLYRNTYSAFLPNVSLSYQYAWRENNTLALDDYSPETFMVNLSFPIFTSFRDVTNTKSEYYAYKQSQEIFNDNLKNTRYTLTETANKIINLKTQMELSATSVEYNEYNYRIAENQKEKGLISNIEFIDAKLNLQNSRLTDIKNEYDFIAAMVELYYLSGQLNTLIK